MKVSIISDHGTQGAQANYTWERHILSYFFKQSALNRSIFEIWKCLSYPIMVHKVSSTSVRIFRAPILNVVLFHCYSILCTCKVMKLLTCGWRVCMTPVFTKTCIIFRGWTVRMKFWWVRGPLPHPPPTPPPPHPHPHPHPRLEDMKWSKDHELSYWSGTMYVQVCTSTWRAGEDDTPWRMKEQMGTERKNMEKRTSGEWKVLLAKEITNGEWRTIWEWNTVGEWKNYRGGKNYGRMNILL